MLVAVIILAIAVWQGVIPIRIAVAKRYVTRGDSYFVHQQFDLAEQEYQSALKYDGKLTEASTREAIAANASTDIAAARPLFVELGQTDEVNAIDQATVAYTDPQKALAGGVAFYNNAQYALARYPLEKAVQLDPNYPEAWNYLALTYDQLAQSNATFQAKAKDARTKRDALTPKYIGQ